MFGDDTNVFLWIYIIECCFKAVKISWTVNRNIQS